MKPVNIISAFQSILALDSSSHKVKTLSNFFNLSKHEAFSMQMLCEEIRNGTSNFNCFNGYYVGYSIKQISKEFDLLRFSDDLIINIELKGKLEDDIKIKKIYDQMNQNNYYLNFLDKNVLIYTYVENDGFYVFNSKKKQPERIRVEELINQLVNQKVNYAIDPDDLFIPSNYLISPFNKTENFINQEYFLTSHQQKIKTEVSRSLENNEYVIYCISANAGTGKTLLVYDIARCLNQSAKTSLIIHCGKLNSGHSELHQDYDWNIQSISSINEVSVVNLITNQTCLIIVDEAQRIRESQLKLIIEKSYEYKIPIIFSYDTKQYLKEGETKDIYEYISDNYKNILIVKRSLTNKIRTNKEISSFIENLLKIGSSNSNLNYDNVTIEYFDSLADVEDYMASLRRSDGWKPITFTTSKYSKEPLNEISTVCNTNAHDVIGQEFKKVVFAMDKNFRYDDKGILMARTNRYSAKGMLFQIITRTIEQLKIIVVNNPDLYFKLLEIKNNN